MLNFKTFLLIFYINLIKNIYYLYALLLEMYKFIYYDIIEFFDHFFLFLYDVYIIIKN